MNIKAISELTNVTLTTAEKTDIPVVGTNVSELSVQNDTDSAIYDNDYKVSNYPIYIDVSFPTSTGSYVSRKFDFSAFLTYIANNFFALANRNQNGLTQAEADQRYLIKLANTPVEDNKMEAQLSCTGGAAFGFKDADNVYYNFLTENTTFENGFTLNGKLDGSDDTAKIDIYSLTATNLTATSTFNAAENCTTTLQGGSNLTINGTLSVSNLHSSGQIDADGSIYVSKANAKIQAIGGGVIQAGSDDKKIQLSGDGNIIVDGGAIKFGIADSAAQIEARDNYPFATEMHFNKISAHTAVADVFKPVDTEQPNIYIDSLGFHQTLGAADLTAKAAYWA